MPIPSFNRYLICSSNINAKPVEPKWMICILSACYSCKFETKLEERIAKQVTIISFHFVLCYESLDSMIWKLGFLLPASCVGYTIQYECIDTGHFEIPPSCVQSDYSSRKSAEVAECNGMPLLA